MYDELKNKLEISKNLAKDNKLKATERDAFVALGFANVNSLSTKLDEYKKRIKELEAEVNVLNGTITKLDKDNKSLMEEMNIVKGDIKKASVKIEELTSTNEAQDDFYKAKIITLDNQLKACQANSSGPVTETQAVGILTRLLNAIKDFLKW